MTLLTSAPLCALLMSRHEYSPTMAVLVLARTTSPPCDHTEEIVEA